MINNDTHSLESTQWAADNTCLDVIKDPPQSKDAFDLLETV